MEMMTPEMIQMMRGMMGEAMLSGMMGQSEGPLADGASAGRMLPMMAGARLAADIHTMIGAMGVLYGMPPGAQEEMTPESVREMLEKILAWHNNPRLRIGEISTAADGSIIAEIVTIDGSLVQKLSFNHYPGLVRQIVD